jgi:hypothetical protein
MLKAQNSSTLADQTSAVIAGASAEMQQLGNRNSTAAG